MRGWGTERRTRDQVGPEGRLSDRPYTASEVGRRRRTTVVGTYRGGSGRVPTVSHRWVEERRPSGCKTTSWTVLLRGFNVKIGTVRVRLSGRRHSQWTLMVPFQSLTERSGLVRLPLN